MGGRGKNNKPDYKQPKVICSKCTACKNLYSNNPPIGDSCADKYRKRTEIGVFIIKAFSAIKARCRTENRHDSHIYYGKKYCTKAEFINWSNQDLNLQHLYKNWQQNNFKFSLTPSVDRINSNGDYTLGIMRWISMGKNVSKSNTERVLKTNSSVYLKSSITGEIKMFIGTFAAEQFLEVSQGYLSKCIDLPKRKAKGWVVTSANPEIESSS